MTTLDGCWCKVPLHPAVTKGRLRIKLAHLMRLQTEEKNLFLRVAIGKNKDADFSKRNDNMLAKLGTFFSMAKQITGSEVKMAQQGKIRH